MVGVMLVSQVESDMAEFEASVAAMEADLDTRMAPHKPGLPSWAVPPAQHKNWPKITSEAEHSAPSSSTGLMCPDKVSTTGDRWEVAVDVASFSPDSLKVKVTGDLVTISGAQVSVIMITSVTSSDNDHDNLCPV